MRKKIELILALAALVGVMAASRELSRHVAGENVEAKRGKEEEKKCEVVIDPGHGADDPGKIGINKALEKDLNLKIAQKTGRLLKEKKISFVFTRDTDESLGEKGAVNQKVADMKKRVSIINESQAKIAVSIHQNSYHEESIRGSQVFYFTHSEEGEKAAKIVQESLHSVDPVKKRQAKENNTYYLLKKTEIPTIIVECGFLSNAAEAEMLCTEEYQQKVAEAICKGIERYISEAGEEQR